MNEHKKRKSPIRWFVLHEELRKSMREITQELAKKAHFGISLCGSAGLRMFGLHSDVELGIIIINDGNMMKCQDLRKEIRGRVEEKLKRLNEKYSREKHKINLKLCSTNLFHLSELTEIEPKKFFKYFRGECIHHNLEEQKRLRREIKKQMIEKREDIIKLNLKEIRKKFAPSNFGLGGKKHVYRICELLITTAYLWYFKALKRDLRSMWKKLKRKGKIKTEGICYDLISLLRELRESPETISNKEKKIIKLFGLPLQNLLNEMEI